MINKMERAFGESEMKPEACYQSYKLLIEHLNDLIKRFSCVSGKEEILDPVRGNVVFGSSFIGFGFTLSKFAQLYSKKFGVRKEKLLSKLWG